MSANLTILIADDDPDDQMLIQEAIEAVGFSHVRIDTVLDGVELMAYLREKLNQLDLPSLILLDLNMPRKDGRASLQEIKADALLAGIPVAIFTTAVSFEDALFCRQLGVNDYYSKPASMQELRKIIANLCVEYLR